MTTKKVDPISPTHPMPTAERAALQRCTLRVLVMGQVVGAAALGRKRQPRWSLSLRRTAGGPRTSERHVKIIANAATKAS